MTSTIVDDLFLSEHKSDITFYIGKDKSNATRFPAHKFFMSFAGPVFSAMLDENFKENATGEVLITDVTPMAFKAVLLFIYTGQFNENINEFEFNEILYASEKYMLEELTKCCLRRLEYQAVNVDSFWTIRSLISTYYSEFLPGSLISKMLTRLSESSDRILRRFESETINYDSLNYIVDSNFLKVRSELIVFNFVLRWSAMECCRQNLDVTPENQRKVLGNVLYKVRYLLMSLDDLENGPLRSKILTDEEKGTIINGCQDNLGVDLLSQNREILKTTRDFSFTITYSFPNTYTYVQSVETAVIFVSSKDIMLSKLEMIVLNFTRLNVNISGFNGRLMKPFCIKQSACEESVPVTVEVCMKAFKCYKISLKCEYGQLRPINQKAVFSTPDSEGKFFVGVPNEICNEFKSEQFWQKFFNGEISGCPDSSEHPIKQFTYISKW